MVVMSGSVSTEVPVIDKYAIATNDMLEEYATLETHERQSDSWGRAEPTLPLNEP